MTDRQFKKLLEWFGLSWNGYYRVRKGVKKRLRKHMQQVGRQSVDGYLELMSEDVQARKQCRILLTVSISRFFRDHDLWRVMDNRIIPGLMGGSADLVRIWSAGCARGEEIYSFKILWDMAGDRVGMRPRLEIRAVDMNPDHVAAARQGVFSASSLREMPKELKDRYFTPLAQKPFFALRDSIKEGVDWQVIDLLDDDPPVQAYHIVFLRNNLLTYYDNALLQPTFAKVVASISTGGYLVIGAKETLPGEAAAIEPSPHYPGLFVKT